MLLGGSQHAACARASQYHVKCKCLPPQCSLYAGYAPFAPESHAQYTMNMLLHVWRSEQISMVQAFICIRAIACVHYVWVQLIKGRHLHIRATACMHYVWVQLTRHAATCCLWADQGGNGQRQALGGMLPVHDDAAQERLPLQRRRRGARQRHEPHGGRPARRCAFMDTGLGNRVREQG